MNKLIANALKTGRFKWGTIITVMSLISLIIISINKQSALEKADQIDNDPRYNESWKEKSTEEKQKLADEKMSAVIQASQIKSGQTFFTLSLTIGILFVILSVIPVKSRADKILDALDDDEETEI